MPGEKATMATPFPSPSSLNLKKESPLMLRDYLRDDFSSCSSNGFKSFPRRQCCPATTVRLLLEFDLQNPKSKPDHRPNLKPKPPLFHHKTRRSAPTTVSAFHRASEAVRRAVKSLPFHSSSSVAVSASGSRKKSLRLPRSISRRLLRKSFFWRKVDVGNKVDNVGRDKVGRESVPWRSFRDFLEEKDHAPPPLEKDLHGGASSPPVVVGWISTSSSGDSRSTDSKSNNCWSGSESEFTADSTESYSGSNKDNGKNDLPSSVSERRAATAGEESTTASAAEIAKPWPTEEKEQFSPVSVLDFPFNDEEEEEEEEEEVEVNSPFHHQILVCVEAGNRNKAMKRTRRLECLSQLQPLDLQKRIATVITEEYSSSSDDESSSTTPELPQQYSQPCTSGEQAVELEEMMPTKAPHELLISSVKERAASSSSNNGGLISRAELLLLDYLEEKSSARGSEKGYEEESLEAVEEWIKGQQKDMFVGYWEVKESTSVYLKHMEEIHGGWRNLGEGKKEVGLELEHDIFTCLINEMLQL